MTTLNLANSSHVQGDRMRFTAIMFVLTLTLAAPVAADELISEPHALVYFQLPFSGAAPDTRSHFGLRMDRTQRAAGQALDYREVMARPAVMDLRFNDSGVESLKFGGVDYLARYRALNADEAPEPDAGAATEPTEGQEKAEEKPKAEEKTAPEEDKLTMDEVMHKFPPGYFIGVGIGIILLVGVGS